MRHRYRSQEDYDAVETTIRNTFGKDHSLSTILLHRFALKIMRYTESKTQSARPQKIHMEEIIAALKEDPLFTGLFADQKSLQSVKKCD